MFGGRRLTTVETIEIKNRDEAHRAALQAAERERAHAEAAERDRRWQEERDAAARRQQEAERAATAAHQERLRRQAEAGQAAQRAWVARRDELRDQVNDLRRRIGEAQGVVDSGPIDEAAQAAGKVTVWTRRLEITERELTAHKQAQPRLYA